MAPVLYNKEREVLQFIAQYIQRHGYAPILTEIAESIGVNAVSTVHEHLKRLEQKGYIKKTQGFERGIEIVDDMIKLSTNESAIELPVLGYFNSGSKLESHEDPNLYEPVPANLISVKKPGYILAAKGNSMVEEGIRDKDMIIVQHQNEAQNGDLIIALLPNGTSTIKRVYFENERVKLSSVYSDMSPIYASHIKIQGKVVAILRKYPSHKED